MYHRFSVKFLFPTNRLTREYGHPIPYLVFKGVGGLRLSLDRAGKPMGIVPPTVSFFKLPLIQILVNHNSE